jgi:SAM-dependent methyltransferase
MGLYVQYGCGFCAPDGWLNFDASPTLLFERIPIVGRLYSKNEQRFPANVRYADVTRGLPLPSASAQGVYASHVLEHLAFVDFQKAIRETYRVLKPGGTFRLVVPDLETLARRYVDAVAAGGADAAPRFMRETRLGVERRPRSLWHFLQDCLGGSRHLWMWDYPSVAEVLAANGFVHIRRACFGDSKDPAFRLVEDPGRFVDACAVEARKPG